MQFERVKQSNFVPLSSRSLLLKRKTFYVLSPPKIDMVQCTFNQTDIHFILSICLHPIHRCRREAKVSINLIILFTGSLQYNSKRFFFLFCITRFRTFISLLPSSSAGDQLHLPMKEKLKPLSPLAEEVFFPTSMCHSNLHCICFHLPSRFCCCWLSTIES
jgi:hypothetical protein